MKIITVTVMQPDGLLSTTVHLDARDAYEALRVHYVQVEVGQVPPGDIDAIIAAVPQGVQFTVDEHDLPPLAVMAVGNPFDGLRLTGPFPSEDAAMLTYAQDHVVDDWWIADLHAPESDEGNEDETCRCKAERGSEGGHYADCSRNTEQNDG